MSVLIKNIVASLIGLFVAILILELFLRVVDPFNFVVKGEEIVLNKNISTVTKYGQTEIVKKVNSLGFIGEELKDNDKPIRIFTIGGSTTACDALKTEDTWPEVLKSKLLDSGKRVWLNNAGFSGHSTYGHNILFRDHVSRLNPDYVIYLIGVNDVGLSKKSLGDNVLIAERDLRNYSFWGKIYYYFTENVHIVTNIVNIARSYKAYQLNINDLDFDLSNLQFADDDPDLEVILLNYHKRLYLDNYRERVKQLVAQTEKTGAKTILVTQPYLGGGNAADISSGVNLGKIAIPLASSWAGVKSDWDLEIEPNRMINANLMWKILELYNDVVRDIAEQNNLTLVDMAKKLEKDSVYYYDMFHYTAAGSQKFADIVHKEIVDKIGNNELK